MIQTFVFLTGPNRDDEKAPTISSIQENVFIETNRPKYLEDLHTEALEGLKMMQQEESTHGMEFTDDMSTVSTATVQADSDAAGFMSDSTIADTSSVVSVQSSVSTKSSRSGLTRQASTFRPLNLGKTPEKTKTKRKHRKTVAGIPQHIQREMGLDRVGWTVTSVETEEQLLNGGNENITDRPQGATEPPTGSSSSSQSVYIIQPISRDQMDQLSVAQAGHRDDLALLQHVGPDVVDGERPRSVAVPGLTTASNPQQELPSPVMSISPQAAYLSKIIPNAVMPPSIDVVEISRGRSRNSVRTVSKSSLLIASPVSSRASSRASSTKASTLNSASVQNTPNVSDSSGWSNSDSSETLVSNSSTISSSSTPKLKSKNGNADASAKEDGVSVRSCHSKVSANGQLIVNEDETKKQGAFARSLSVMKPKKAPPPPNRSFSLHNKMKRRSRDLAEVRVISDGGHHHSISASGVESEHCKPGSSPSSPGYHADTSSLEDSVDSPSVSPVKSQLQPPQVEDSVTKDGSPEKQKYLQENKLNKVISPSSGYSSQDGTPAQHSKHSSSPRFKKGILAKLQKLFPGSSPTGSPPSPLVSPGTSTNIKVTEHLMSQSNSSVDTVSVSPSVRALRELLNIPPPPKIHAPPPPPPEVWAHNKRTFELLLGPPAPDITYTVIKKNPKDRRQQRHIPVASTEGSLKTLIEERNHKVFTAESTNGSLHVLGVKKVQASEILNVQSGKENHERLAHMEQSVDLKGNSKVTEMTGKMKVSEMLSGILMKAAEKRHEKPGAVKTEAKTHVDPVSAISLVNISPSVTPSPSHHPPHPPTKQTTYVGVTQGANQVPTSPDASWPLPPPPMAQTSWTIVSGKDETDLPLPPPPIFSVETFVLQSETSTCGPVGLQDSSTAMSVTPVVETSQDKCAVSSSSEKVDDAVQITPTTPLNIPPPPPYAAPPPPSAAPHPPSQSAPLPLIVRPCINSVPPPPPPPHLPPEKVCFSAFKEVSPSPPKDLSPLPPTETFPPPPKEFSPSSPKEVSLPLLTEIFPLPPKEFSLLPLKHLSPLPPQEASPMPIKEVFPPVQDVSSHLMKESGPFPLVEVTTLPPVQEVTPPSCPPSEKAVPVVVGILSPPHEPAPPLQSETRCSDQNGEDIPVKSETVPFPSNSVIYPHKSVPPPLPLERLPQSLALNTDSPATQDASPLPSDDDLDFASSLPVYIPPPRTEATQVSAFLNKQTSPPCTENQSQESDSVSVRQEQPRITPSLLQMVKLRSSGSPDPIQARDHPQPEVMMRSQQPSHEIPSQSSSGEAPQKPIRRSLIMTSSTVVTSQSTAPTTDSTVVPPESSPTVVSPTKLSPPPVTVIQSMKLQEAIRLRTAARSKDGPPTRISLHSPTSPLHADVLKSPTSTASFIFSKSSRKVVIETKPYGEAAANLQNPPAVVSSVTKKQIEAESLKKGVKVPPPVAKKPATKVESSAGGERTAGQEAPESSDCTAEPHGTESHVKGEQTLSP
ncbi:uncharacterized protein KIAA1522 homolog isoform X2 [Thalassophryne amazonica]|uniref:uncharacterized protein KIAA1522 homolog isoform X2 n=1 Tax=Thalassophryne amazonica TaxID=390379 RepID=UPI001471D8C4|nr:uncharacterized protein KIAA1522 homolog isoform X2 [Thalassophryne amazonica]